MCPIPAAVLGAYPSTIRRRVLRHLYLDILQVPGAARHTRLHSMPLKGCRTSGSTPEFQLERHPAFVFP